MVAGARPFAPPFGVDGRPGERGVAFLLDGGLFGRGLLPSFDLSLAKRFFCSSSSFVVTLLFGCFIMNFLLPTTGSQMRAVDWAEEDDASGDGGGDSATAGAGAGAGGSGGGVSVFGRCFFGDWPCKCAGIGSPAAARSRRSMWSSADCIVVPGVEREASRGVGGRVKAVK